MTHDDLDRLEALAAAATPGPWRAYTTRIGRHYVQDIDTYAVAEAQQRNQRDANGPENAAYIAALSPSVVSELVAAARLGFAWQAAEAALPEGPWLLEVGRRGVMNGDENPYTGYVIDRLPDRYFASAGNTWSGDETLEVGGPTPAAALLSLAEALRGRK